jgi:glycosyltransferase involved in cell wall biosynthesis
MSTTAMTPLSVVMPAYNEEDAIEQAVQDVQAHVLAVVPAAEFVVIDDGSRDRTPVLLDRSAARDGRVRVIHQANGGHGRALITGLEAATETSCS